MFHKRSVLVLFFYIALSFVLMGLNDAAALRGIRLVLLQGIALLHAVKEKIEVIQITAEENRMLRQENFRLKLTNQKLREALLENARLRRMLNIKKGYPYPLVAARVIGNGVEEGVRSLILNVGETDSVFKNYPVICADGLVGKIIVTTPHQSIAQVLMDHNSLVSARLQRSREVGVIAWSGNSWLELLYIPKNISVETGELVITSGLSKIYPPGLKIGVVTDIRENEYEFFKEIRVQPAVRYNALEEVFVIRRPQAQLMEIQTGE